MSKIASFAKSPAPEFFSHDGEKSGVEPDLQLGDRPAAEQSSFESESVELLVGQSLALSVFELLLAEVLWAGAIADLPQQIVSLETPLGSQAEDGLVESPLQRP